MSNTDNSKSGSNPANASLIKRFNHHSMMVMKSSLPSSSSSEKRPTVPAAATTDATSSSSSFAAAAAGVGALTVDRLSSDVTVNGGIHVSGLKTKQNSAIDTGAAVVSTADDVSDKYVRLSCTSV